MSATHLDRVEAACRAYWGGSLPSKADWRRNAMSRALAAADAITPVPKAVREALHNALSLVELKFGNTDATANAVLEQGYRILATPAPPADTGNETEVERLTRERDEMRAEVEALRRSEDEWASKTEVAQSYADTLIGAKNRLQARAEAAEARLARAREALDAYDKADGVDAELVAIGGLRRALADSEPAVRAALAAEGK